MCHWCSYHIRFEFWTERSVSDGGNLCPPWSVILESVWNSIGVTFLAAIQLTMSWSELYFTRCCALKRTGKFASESKVMSLCLFYLIFKRDVLMFLIPDINQCVNNHILRLIKVEFIVWINLKRFVYWVCLIIFSEPFSKKETALSLLFLLDYASRTCSMPRQYNL